MTSIKLYFLIFPTPHTMDAPTTGDIFKGIAAAMVNKAKGLYNLKITERKFCALFEITPDICALARKKGNETCGMEASLFISCGLVHF